MPKIGNRYMKGVTPRDKKYTVWDEQLKGFGIEVRPKGSISFVVKYRNAEGRQRMAILGTHPALTPEKARKMALSWQAKLIEGVDPLEMREASKNAITLNAFTEIYMRDHARVHKKPSSIRNDEVALRRILPVLGQKRLDQLTAPILSRFHASLKDAPYHANRCLRQISSMLSIAEKWGYFDGPNPCSQIKKFKEERRTRYLSGEELKRLGQAMHEAETGRLIYPPALAAIRLMLASGMRKGEVLSLRWRYVNSSRGVLELPDSKTGKKEIVLSRYAMAILDELDTRTSEWVFPSDRLPDAHIKDIRSVWDRLCKVARIENCRPHDARHSFASLAVSGGASLPIIGNLLGHRNESTTQRYAHLAVDPVRAVADEVGGQLEQYMSAGGANVIEVGSPMEPIHSKNGQ